MTRVSKAKGVCRCGHKSIWHAKHGWFLSDGETDSDSCIKPDCPCTIYRPRRKNDSKKR